MSKSVPSIDDLKDPGLEKSLGIDWTVQRIGWVCMALVLVAALLGYLGRGPLTQRHAAAEDGTFSVEYYGVERYESPTELRIRVHELPQDGPLEVAIGKRFFDVATLEDISPPPASASLRGDEVVHTFDVEDAGDLLIVLRYKHDDYGPLTYSVSLPGRAPVTVNQYVLP